MDIGIPRETHVGEQRAALTPAGAKALVQKGHRVWVERGAGTRAGFEDGEYQAAGASIAYARDELYARAQVVAAVFAPEVREFALLRPEQVVLAFWMLPIARREDVQQLLEREVTAIGLEAVADRSGHAPVLESMSEIAGALSITVGGCLLLNAFGGKGLLLGGVAGVPPAHVAILGAGVLGRAAARAALGAGAQVMLLDSQMEPLRTAVETAGRGLATMLATPSNIEKALGFADLVLGAVAVRGERAPVLVDRSMLRLMKPKSVVLDLSIDMGGCFETSRPTSFPDPIYEVDGIIHCCVPNLPSAAARSASVALTNALLPYLFQLGESDIERAVAGSGELRRGLYLYRGRCAQDGLARAFDLPLGPLPWPAG